jgi:microcystin-dependent protein
MQRVLAVRMESTASRAKGPSGAREAHAKSDRGTVPPRSIEGGIIVSEPFLGQLMTVGFNFAPRGWSTCGGQLMSIAQNTALFSLLGVTYGGDGQTTFALPNFVGRVPMGCGASNAGSAAPINQGELGGLTQQTLTLINLPQHNHTAAFTSTTSTTSSAFSVTGGFTDVGVTVSGAMQVVTANGTDNDPIAAGTFGAVASGAKIYAASNTGTAVNLAPISSTGKVSGSLNSGASGSVTLPPVTGTIAVGVAGLSQPFSILPPFLGILNVIALEGIFPSRN